MAGKGKSSIDGGGINWGLVAPESKPAQPINWGLTPLSKIEQTLGTNSGTSHAQSPAAAQPAQASAGPDDEEMLAQRQGARWEKEKSRRRRVLKPVAAKVETTPQTSSSSFPVFSAERPTGNDSRPTPPPLDAAPDEANQFTAWHGKRDLSCRYFRVFFNGYKYMFLQVTFPLSAV